MKYSLCLPWLLTGSVFPVVVVENEAGVVGFVFMVFSQLEGRSTTKKY